ncbi:phycobilisome protein [Chamaesiphon minutus]|uniref:Phycobilisome protein n=1 Tax=Chamaesiphon minutus (strain ATCC 27169 / PCC 6605) TaxID=1173020 RepID=K9UMU4_CHAP6|nr:phycobilisome protein [Chamaesiphon minutus]AFY95983.1 Phycobilisome protein [Chamaesiphon minutus PCC 6605]
MITLLEALVDGADGSYASKQDLRKLEHVISSWAERKEAYLAIEAKEKEILDRAIKAMEDSKIFQEQAMNALGVDRCRRDMTLGLRAYSLAMLLQDEEMLKERFIHWQKNILQAMGFRHYQGYKFLLEAIYVELPQAHADLLKPYIKIAQDAISAI